MTRSVRLFYSARSQYCNDSRKKIEKVVIFYNALYSQCRHPSSKNDNGLGHRSLPGSVIIFFFASRIGRLWNPHTCRIICLGYSDWVTKITSIYSGIESCLENSTFNIIGYTETGTTTYLLCVLGLGLITGPNYKFGHYQIPQLASVAPNHLPKLKTFCVAAKNKFHSVIYCSLEYPCPLVWPYLITQSFQRGGL